MLLPSVIQPIGRTLFGSGTLESGYTIESGAVADQTNQSTGSVIPPNLLDKL
jgi:hypothetical protein